MRKSIPLFFALSILLVLSSFGLAIEKKVYPCYRLTKEPILDGELRHDAAWKTIPAETDFVKVGRVLQKIASKQTLFKIGYNAENFYIGIECEEPEIEKIKAELKNMQRLWTAMN